MFAWLKKLRGAERPIRVTAREDGLGSPKFEQAIRQLAEAVYRTVASEMAAREWSHAVLEVRYNGQGSAWLSKIRAATPSGGTVSIMMNNEIDLVLISLSAMRRTASHDEWFGLSLNVDRGRQCTIDLNYDRRCHEDASFFEA
jgi:hypothetical protein